MGPIELASADVELSVGDTSDDDRIERMNVEDPGASGADVIDSTGLEFITAAVPINGPMEAEPTLVAAGRGAARARLNWLSCDRKFCVAAGSVIAAG